MAMPIIRAEEGYDLFNSAVTIGEGYFHLSIQKQNMKYQLTFECDFLSQESVG